MKLSFIFAFVTSVIFGQTMKREFQITTYVGGIEYRKEVKSIETVMDSVDLKFINKHFNIPYHLPEELVNKKLAGKTVTIWNDENKKEDLVSNWKNTYKYDEFGRITDYEYSGCVACSDFAFKFKVIYNEKGQIIELKNNLFKKEFFEIKYNDVGEIIELKSCSQNGKTDTLIEALE